MFTKNFLFISCSVLLMLAAVLMPVTPVYVATSAPVGNAEQTTKATTSSLLQYTSSGHILGFNPNKVYLAGLDHALTVEFIGVIKTLVVLVHPA
jgi:hypothetical protein